MKIIFMGSDSFVVPVLETLQENFEVIAVVTAPESAISKFFQDQIFIPDKLDDDFTNQIQKLEPDLIIVSSYGKIIPQSILDIPKFGALNVHPSLLPKHRGASPVPAAILNGDSVTGVTIIKMDEKMDHGPIITTSKIKLTGKEILPDLITKLFQLGAELLVNVIPDFVSGKLVPKVQDHTKATFCKMMKKEDGYFDLPAGRQVLSSEFLEELDRKIRAYFPWPGVWTTWSPSAKASGDKNGKIVKFFPEGKIQMEGKKIIPLKDFLNGYPSFPITNISSIKVLTE